ncbi:MAG: bifunctional aspartate kinase/homoserine dehydrogenase I [Spirochaetaceae bacterium]|jgi:aspartokinase/homoserine dehydrogenase 1|nr:bifunctional aspartate kinase/homoserine dehydrogenase I [Spirochaetaceae bacterium]
MLVLKFGGSSVGSAGALERVAGILTSAERSGRVRVVVVSALNGITDGLIAAARKAAAGDGSYAEDAAAMKERHLDLARSLTSGEPFSLCASWTESVFSDLGRILDGVSVVRELSARILDYVMSFGERLSAYLLTQILSCRGYPAEYLDSRELIRSDRNYGAAAFLPEASYALIRAHFEARRSLQVAAGFIASTEDGATTTLGRGGSDLSAAIYGAALDAEAIEIWTDVDGILTADPRLVKNAFKIDSISYIETMELSHFGAKVLYPPTVRPALEKGIPIRILNTFKPGEGTLISADAPESPWPIRGISSLSNVTLIRLQGSGMVGVAGFSSRLFGALARRGISVILITQSSSEYSICFAVEPPAAYSAAAALMEEFDREIGSRLIEAPIVEPGLSIIAVVGSRMKSRSGISGRVFYALGRNGVNIVAIAQGSSELNISAVISRQDEAKAVNAIHEAFFLAGVRSVNLFLVGIGLIGGTLVDQIASHREILADEQHIRINLTGVANSRGMIFDADGLDPGTVKGLLKGPPRGAAQGAGEDAGPEVLPFEIGEFIGRMKALNLPNTAFCDCSSGADVAERYAEILAAAIPVVTPNKKANSSSLEYYRTLTGFSRERGIPYLYETTVCAGLPVISTLRDLAYSGDRVRRIEAVLSGTLSFIFNNFDGSRSFSELVREARSKGYTEPDPRDDLNAMDAARKALILARECGMSLEFEAVAIEPLLPAACFEAAGVESFFEELKKSDALFEERRRKAAAGGKALRYVAVIEDGSATIRLREEAPGSPFRSLVDADNIVVITTDRYSKLPMVIKGPGAGAEVTAGGVFADIVRIARTLV